MNYISSPQVKCPTQIILRAMMNPGAPSTVGIHPNPRHTASLGMVACIQASPLHPTSLIQIPRCTLGSRGVILGEAILGGAILEAPTPDSLTRGVLLEPATPAHLQFLL